MAAFPPAETFAQELHQDHDVESIPSASLTEKPDFISAGDETEREQDFNGASTSGPSKPALSPAGWPPFVQQLYGWRLFCVQACLLLGLFLSAMESSIVATALVTIAKSFEDYIKVQWVVLAYLLTYMGFSVIITRSSDVFGRKLTIASCIVIFGVFSLACGLSRSMTQLIGFRALQGIGGSGLFAMCMVCLPELTPPKYFPAMSGAVGAAFAFSSVLGPLLGGAITKTNWRWIFFLNCPVACVMVAVLLVAWRHEDKTHFKQIPLIQVDYLGATLLLAASVLIVFALQEGGATTYAWNSPVIIATLVVGACCWVAFALWIWVLGKRAEKCKIQSILPATIFKNRVISGVLLSTLLTGYTFLSVLIELPQRFQIVNEESPVTAGVHLLPLLIGSAFGSLLGGLLNSKKDFTFYTLNFATALILLACGLLSTLPVSFTVSHAQYAYQFILGLGTGMTFSTATIMTARGASPADRAAAQGAVSQARIFGGSIGLAVATIVLNGHLNNDLLGVLTLDQLANLRQSLSAILELTRAQQGAVVKVFAASFNDQLRICTYVAAASLLASSTTFPKKKVQGSDPTGPAPVADTNPPVQDEV